MRALAKLVAINSPDKILFVGEALVGNEAVDQLTKFDRALKDFSAASGTGKERGIDGMLVTKWDTVDDKVHTLHLLTRGNIDENLVQVGAALSMTYVTGQPIVFVGCGQVSIPTLSFAVRSRMNLVQTYTDLRQLRVENVVEAILGD